MKWLLLVFLLLAQAGISACALDLANLAAEDESWQGRVNGTLPATASERLAAEVMTHGRKPIARGNLMASYEGEESGYSVVAVTETPVDATEPVKKIRYRMQGERIYFESYPQYIAQVDKQREANAREVALQAKEGRNPNRPMIYDHKYMYVPSFDGNCTVDVTEMDTDRNPVFDYHFDFCQ